MIDTSANALNSGIAASKAAALPAAAQNSSKGGPAAHARGPGHAAAPGLEYESDTTRYSAHTESLHLKYTSRDGDVLELQADSSEISYSSETVRFSATARALAAGKDGKPAGEADADGNAAAATEDPKAKQLAELREWAKQVEKELRQQQHKLLEQILKQSGRAVDSGEGKFLLLRWDGSGDPSKTQSGGEAEDAEPQVPAYWNAENTSDRIVHFATQMAEISGLDPQTIIDAVGKGFDQANAITGDLPGAAGKLNKDTRDLVNSKLTKWLEDRKSEAYNQGTQSNSTSTADVPYGIENHKQ